MPNTQRKFDPNVIFQLGEYVYALQDPRDNKVFYIGKGQGDRLFDHFNETDDALKNTTQSNWKAKTSRIAEIWNEGLDVEWWIIRYNLQNGTIPPLDVFDVEAALIDVLEISQNGPTLNNIAGHRKATRGILSSVEVAALAVQAVNPKEIYPAVFIFPIQNALAKGISVYDATRRLWAVSQPNRNLTPSLAVGMANGVSQGVFEIDKWIWVPAYNKFEFTGNDITNVSPLANTSWLTIIGSAIGYWQRGNYLIVEFNGKNQFRFIRGSSNTSWQPL